MFKIMQAAPEQGQTFVMLLVAHNFLTINRVEKVFVFNPNEALTSQIENLVIKHEPIEGQIIVLNGHDFVKAQLSRTRSSYSTKVTTTSKSICSCLTVEPNPKGYLLCGSARSSCSPPRCINTGYDAYVSCSR